MDKAHRKTDEKLEEMERHLSTIYSRAGKELEKSWKGFLKESEKDLSSLEEAYKNAKGKQALDEAKKIGRDIAEAKKKKVLTDKWYRKLIKQTAEQLTHVNEIALAYVNDQLPEVYALNYNSLAPDVDGVGGYSFTLTDPTTVKNLATKDHDLLPYKQIDPLKDIPWNKKHIQAELLQGILQGESIPKIAKRMQTVTDMNESASVRNARTMVTGSENRGRQDSYEKAQKDGIILKKEWVSAIDGRTRHAHRLLDGQQVEIDEPFHSDLGDIRYPGDPEAKPANVYNCRCTQIAKVIGFKKVSD